MTATTIPNGYYKINKGEETLVGTVFMAGETQLFEWGPKAVTTEQLVEKGFEFTRLTPVDEVEKAWWEAYDYTTCISDNSIGTPQRRWRCSRANKVKEGAL